MASKEDLLWLGLSEAKAAETLKNAKLTETIGAIIKNAKEIGLKDAKQTGTLLYQLATKLKPQVSSSAPLIVGYVVSGGIKSETQLSAAIEYLLANVVKGVEVADFEKACGVGIVVTIDDIEDAVTKVFSKYKDQIVAERYAFNVGKLLGELRGSLPWADGAVTKREVDLRLLELLGPKTAEDLAPKKKEKKEKKVEPAKAAGKQKQETTQQKKTDEPSLDAFEDGAETMDELLRSRAHFHKVGENFKAEGYVTTEKTAELLKQHVAAVGGKVVTRFPPEPNGVLHIGHAKAININFGYAQAMGGVCNLRFDDTNPEKEEEKFFTAIEDMVHWLGYAPAKVTHSSDNFHQLYHWAIKLIEKGLAYVCHQKVEEMRGFEVQLSPWRERPVKESLQLFEDMKHGKFDEGEATLRLKLTLEEGKVDPVAYRIKYVPHHRTGDEWCIYPTYDYTHCLCDSIENITHSLCTKEFQSRRSSYYWLCNALDIYCPVQWEYGRLNVSYTVVSKRKILKLITTKTVADWDDPRLFTLTALRRRGIPSEAVNRFIAKLGLTMSQMVIDPHLLDATVRDYLNVHAPRTMAVLEGLKLTIENFDELNLPSTFEVPDFPSDVNDTRKHTVSVDKEIFIEKTDYKSDDSDKSFRRLTPKQPVGLKHIGLVLRLVKEVKDSVGNVTELVVHATKMTSEEKPKAFIHWVAKPVSAEVRLYDRLFKSKNPEDAQAVPGGFLTDINPDSLNVLYNALIDQSVAKSKVYDRFQFERIGFFCVDRDSNSSKLVFNRTVMLKDGAGKN
uniref:Probable glutamine--tRNA ligase n=1 Tax=Caenorhabditis japonica TaxID=281687 RepID=A0A8R1DXH1_CAEJA